MTSVSAENKPDYLPGLNGIRALSAFLVISAHWPTNFLSLKFGWIGVNIFFVLSGFLITRILLIEKERSLKNYLLNFYYKRSLRIFPVYYLFLFAISAIILSATYYQPSLLSADTWNSGYLAVKHDLIYYLTYTYNLKLNLRYFLDLSDYANQFLAHLWSLAVEEQFYLVFPFVVYFSSVNTLKKIIISLIVICPLIRLWASIYGIRIISDHYWLGELLYTNTFCQADALAAGAALAVFNFNLYKPYLIFFTVLLIWLIIGLICLYFLRKAGYFLIEGKSLGYNFPGFWFDQPTKWFLINIRPFYQYTLVNLLAVTLILPATLKRPLFPKIFNNAFIDYLGKISYGIYLFHNPLIGFMVVLLGYFGGLELLAHNPVLDILIFLIYCTTVIIIAHLSYTYFEKKFLALKHSQKLSFQI